MEEKIAIQERRNGGILMKRQKKISRWRQISVGLIAVVCFAVLGIQTVFAASSTISSVSITVDVDIAADESLPSLTTGYTGDTGFEVMVPSNDKYDIDKAKWTSDVDEAKIGGTYTMKVYLKALNDYRFSGSYPSSKVKVKGADYVSAQRSGSGTLVVTLKTKPAEGTLDTPDEAYWESTRYSSSQFGRAKWDAVKNAAYDVYLYRGSKVVYKATDVHSTSYNFYPYMTTKGTYTFRVRAVPSSDSVSKYADKSDWSYSDELYVEEDEVSDGSGQDKNNAGSQPTAPETNQVGWIQNSGRWYFRYPDGTYLTDSWGLISGVWYLFDSTGAMQTGWQQRNGVWYYLNSSGAMQTGWFKDGQTWYYLNADGAMQTGWVTLGENVYYCYDNGAMATGWITVDGNIYYFYPDGHRASNAVVDGFYVDGNGIWKKP